MRINNVGYNSTQNKQKFGQLLPKSPEVEEYISKLFRTSTDKKQRFDKLFREAEIRQNSNKEKDIEFFLEDLGLGIKELGVKIKDIKRRYSYSIYAQMDEPVENVPFKLFATAEECLTQKI